MYILYDEQCEHELNVNKERELTFHFLESFHLRLNGGIVVKQKLVHLLDVHFKVLQECITLVTFWSHIWFFGNNFTESKEHL